MKNIKIKVVCCVTILLLIALFTGCGKGSFSIEGTWDTVDHKGNAGIMEFKSNGTYISKVGMFQIGGNYTFENNKLTLVYGEEDPLNYEIDIIDNESIKYYSIDAEGNRTEEENGSMTKQN
ncbi:hypothetical protein [Pontibacillus litoralis]|uniref:DUF5640 domain-containing protein n=1 Tax=Pontibacillus litoralis JSM 072002 TaxID=1385512 RepID=A0A0A5FWK5_9BACI|nr:hypothetical protein [Pontibacillus litoralis]KGX85171.1 hypothetical protein N784_09755 [Pontibacillus litoralis JSM 072002]